MRHGRRPGGHQADRAADRRRSGRRARRRVGRVAARLGATRARRGPAQGSGVAAVPAAARGDGDAPRDRPHRGRDDGEPLLRQHPGDPARPAGPGGRRPAVPAGAGAGRQPRRAGRARPGVARADGVPGARRAVAGLEREPHRVRRRPQRRLRPRQRARRDAVLHRGRPAVHPRAGPALPRRRALLLLVPGPDVPELPLPADGHVERRDPDGHLDVLGARRQRHDLRPLRPRTGSRGGRTTTASRHRRHPARPAALARRRTSSRACSTSSTTRPRGGCRSSASSTPTTSRSRRRTRRTSSSGTASWPA